VSSRFFTNLSYIQHNTTTEKCQLLREHRWLVGIPSEIRQGFVNDLRTAFRSHIASIEKAVQQGWAPPEFRLKERNARGNESVVIPKARYNNCTAKSAKYYALVNMSSSPPKPSKTNTANTDATPPSRRQQKRDASAVPKVVYGAMRILRDRKGRWYFLIPRRVLAKCAVCQAPPQNLHNVISIDPGVRCCMYGYSPDGQVFLFGDEDNKRIRHFHHALAILRRDMKHAADANQRRSMKRHYDDMYSQMRNRIREMHIRIATFLCQNFEVILIPEFCARQMVKKLQRSTAKGIVVPMVVHVCCSFCSVVFFS